MRLFKFKKNNEPRITTPRQVLTSEQREEMRWENRRYETARALILQDRKSVILGKLRATPEKIAKDACRLTDAMIRELRKDQSDER